MANMKLSAQRKERERERGGKEKQKKRKKYVRTSSSSRTNTADPQQIHGAGPIQALDQNHIWHLDL